MPAKHDRQEFHSGVDDAGNILMYAPTSVYDGWTVESSITNIEGRVLLLESRIKNVNAFRATAVVRKVQQKYFTAKAIYIGTVAGYIRAKARITNATTVIGKADGVTDGFTANAVIPTPTTGAITANAVKKQFALGGSFTGDAAFTNAVRQGPFSFYAEWRVSAKGSFTANAIFLVNTEDSLWLSFNATAYIRRDPKLGSITANAVIKKHASTEPELAPLQFVATGFETYPIGGIGWQFSASVEDFVAEQWAGYTNVATISWYGTSDGYPTPADGGGALQADFTSVADQGFLVRIPGTLLAGQFYTVRFRVKRISGSGNYQAGIGSESNPALRKKVSFASYTYFSQSYLGYAPTQDITDPVFWIASWGSVSMSILVDAVIVQDESSQGVLDEYMNWGWFRSNGTPGGFSYYEQKPSTDAGNGVWSILREPNSRYGPYFYVYSADEFQVGDLNVDGNLVFSYKARIKSGNNQVRWYYGVDHQIIPAIYETMYSSDPVTPDDQWYASDDLDPIAYPNPALTSEWKTFTRTYSMRSMYYAAKAYGTWDDTDYWYFAFGILTRQHYEALGPAIPGDTTNFEVLIDDLFLGIPGKDIALTPITADAVIAGHYEPVEKLLNTDFSINNKEYWSPIHSRDPRYYEDVNLDSTEWYVGGWGLTVETYGQYNQEGAYSTFTPDAGHRYIATTWIKPKSAGLFQLRLGYSIQPYLFDFGDPITIPFDATFDTLAEIPNQTGTYGRAIGQFSLAGFTRNDGYLWGKNGGMSGSQIWFHDAAVGDATTYNSADLLVWYNPYRSGFMDIRRGTKSLQFADQNVNLTGQRGFSFRVDHPFDMDRAYCFRSWITPLPDSSYYGTWGWTLAANDYIGLGVGLPDTWRLYSTPGSHGRYEYYNSDQNIQNLWRRDYLFFQPPIDSDYLLFGWGANDTFSYHFYGIVDSPEVFEVLGLKTKTHTSTITMSGMTTNQWYDFANSSSWYLTTDQLKAGTKVYFSWGVRLYANAEPGQSGMSVQFRIVRTNDNVVVKTSDSFYLRSSDANAKKLPFEAEDVIPSNGAWTYKVQIRSVYSSVTTITAYYAAGGGDQQPGMFALYHLNPESITAGEADLDFVSNEGSHVKYLEADQWAQLSTEWTAPNPLTYDSADLAISTFLPNPSFFSVDTASVLDVAPPNTAITSHAYITLGSLVNDSFTADAVFVPQIGSFTATAWVVDGSPSYPFVRRAWLVLDAEISRSFTADAVIAIEIFADNFDRDQSGYPVGDPRRWSPWDWDQWAANWDVSEENAYIDGAFYMQQEFGGFMGLPLSSSAVYQFDIRMPVVLHNNWRDWYATIGDKGFSIEIYEHDDVTGEYIFSIWGDWSGGDSLYQDVSFYPTAGNEYYRVKISYVEDSGDIHWATKIWHPATQAEPAWQAQGQVTWGTKSRGSYGNHPGEIGYWDIGDFAYNQDGDCIDPVAYDNVSVMSYSTQWTVQRMILASAVIQANMGGSGNIDGLATPNAFDSSHLRVIESGYGTATGGVLNITYPSTSQDGDMMLLFVNVNSSNQNAYPQIYYPYRPTQTYVRSAGYLTRLSPSDYDFTLASVFYGLRVTSTSYWRLSAPANAGVEYCWVVFKPGAVLMGYASVMVEDWPLTGAHEAAPFFHELTYDSVIADPVINTASWTHEWGNPTPRLFGMHYGLITWMGGAQFNWSVDSGWSDNANLQLASSSAHNSISLGVFYEVEPAIGGIRKVFSSVADATVMWHWPVTIVDRFWFTANSIVKRTQESSFTSDSVKRQEMAGSFDPLAIIIPSGSTATHYYWLTADAVISS